ncbi:MAG: hypothetical protein PHX27_03320 [Candidatus ainarchaeum sp.]|nr:hypothetical protein [Candidatus ainarchaeum sp.]
MIKINYRGQFFSPDLIIAVLIFVTCLGFFFVTSDSIFGIVNLSEEKNMADEVIHSVMNVLVYSNGFPTNWEDANLIDVNVFGLASSKNVISEKKLLTFINHLDNNYLFFKEKMGLGKFDFKLQLINSEGNISYSSNKEFVNTEFELNYDRIVLFDNDIFILRGVIALEKR